MGGNSFGILFKVSTFGESHGPALGCIVDGCPAGLSLSAEDIRRELERRRPGASPITSNRREPDEPEILSGIYEGKTLGTPIAILVRNFDARSEDYDYLKDIYRPGHADFSWEAKYGFRDHRGGGRSSARETVGRVAAGAIAKVFLATMDIKIESRIISIAGIEDSCLMTKRLEEISAAGDTAGCIVECMARNVPAGLGEPVFDKLDARIAAAMLSIGAAKAIEFGSTPAGGVGFVAARSLGSEMNYSPDSNNSGGVLGGISTGEDFCFRVGFKPIPSIKQPQTVNNRNGEKTEIMIKGRHDICAAPRVLPVVEAMTALVLADFVLLQRSDRL